MTNINLANLINSLGFKINGAIAGGSSGYSVANAGDVNGDGVDDMLIGAPYANSNAGISYVIFGQKNVFGNINLTGLNASTGFSILGDIANTYSGYSVAGAGDVNGDGISDFLIGAPNQVNSDRNNAQNTGNPSNGATSGAVYLIYGSDSDFSDRHLSILSSSQGFAMMSSKQGVGYSISAAGDVNKDGYADIIIGSGTYGCGWTGSAYLLFGKSGNSNLNLDNLKSSSGFTITAEKCNGLAVSNSGDVNGDGYPDLLIGNSFGGNAWAGNSYIIFGRSSGFSDIYLPSITASQGVIISGINSNDYSGFSIGAAGDINKDGFADIIVGAYGTNYYGGTAYIVFGGTNLTNINLLSLSTSAGFYIKDASTNDYNGYSVSGIGDINGDGIDDVITGAYGAGSNAGTSYVIYGKKNSVSNILTSSLGSSQGFSIKGATSGDQSGYSVSGGGDFNGDGIKDIVIGAPGAASAAGAVYVLFGAISPTSMPTHSPTTKPTITPTTIPSIAPTAPTSSPIFAPTATPTVLPTLIPTFAPTLHPTSHPTLVPTAMPSNEPSTTPTASPTVAPTLPYLPIIITNGGMYVSTSLEREDFIIKLSANTALTITSTGGGDEFTISPNYNVTVTITDFDPVNEVINLSEFHNIYSFSDLNITEGSIIINLPARQIIRLLDLLPPDISADNFIFADAPTSAPTNTPMNDKTSGLSTNAIIEVAFGGAGCLLMAGLIYYVYKQCIRPLIAIDNDDINIDYSEVNGNNISPKDIEIEMPAPSAPMEKDYQHDIPIAYAVEVPSDHDAVVNHDVNWGSI